MLCFRPFTGRKLFLFYYAGLTGLIMKRYFYHIHIEEDIPDEEHC